MEIKICKIWLSVSSTSLLIIFWRWKDLIQIKVTFDIFRKEKNFHRRPIPQVPSAKDEYWSLPAFSYISSYSTPKKSSSEKNRISKPQASGSKWESSETIFAQRQLGGFGRTLDSVMNKDYNYVSRRWEEKEVNQSRERLSSLSSWRSPLGTPSKSGLPLTSS